MNEYGFTWGQMEVTRGRLTAPGSPGKQRERMGYPFNNQQKGDALPKFPPKTSGGDGANGVPILSLPKG